jgi:hypothetical protein
MDVMRQHVAYAYRAVGTEKKSTKPQQLYNTPSTPSFLVQNRERCEPVQAIKEYVISANIHNPND